MARYSLVLVWVRAGLLRIGCLYQSCDALSLTMLRGEREQFISAAVIQIFLAQGIYRLLAGTRIVARTIIKVFPSVLVPQCPLIIESFMQTSPPPNNLNATWRRYGGI